MPPPVEPAQLGAALMHEHLLCDLTPPERRLRGDWDGPEGSTQNHPRPLLPASGRARSRRRPPAPAIALNVLDEEFHRLDLANLTLNDLVRQPSNARIGDTRFPRVVDGDRVVRNHGFHECDVRNCGLSPVDNQQTGAAHRIALVFIRQFGQRSIGVSYALVLTDVTTLFIYFGLAARLSAVGAFSSAG